MFLDKQYEKMATYLKTLDEHKQIDLEDIGNIYSMKLNIPKNKAIWYTWGYDGNLILNNGPQAVVETMIVSFADDEESCMYKGKPLTAMMLRRMCCKPLQAEPINLGETTYGDTADVVVI